MARYASPARILVEGSNGVSSAGNCFGEPLIGGFTRTFGLMANGERREFRKPILYSGGMGRIQAIDSEKKLPEIDMLIIRIGGPAYRIGVGGGSASSMMQGENAVNLDFDSVQRGDPEMENRATASSGRASKWETSIPSRASTTRAQAVRAMSSLELLEPVGGKIDIRRHSGRQDSVGARNMERRISGRIRPPYQAGTAR